MRLRIATRRRGVMGTAATVAAVIFLAAGCAASGSGTSGSAGSGGGTATGGTASASGGLIIDVNGDLANPIFPAVLEGAKAAAKELGINFQYSAPPNESNFVPDYSALIKEAIARHPAAMVIGDFVPSAFDPLIKEATRKGIPVVVMNTGINSWRTDGALAFVGEDRSAGRPRRGGGEGGHRPPALRQWRARQSVPNPALSWHGEGACCRRRDDGRAGYPADRCKQSRRQHAGHPGIPELAPGHRRRGGIELIAGRRDPRRAPQPRQDGGQGGDL